MAVSKSPEYHDRSINEWLSMAEQGQIALPTFQRSYVWSDEDVIEKYVNAVLENRPTGIFLLIQNEPGAKPLFPSRTVKDVDADSGNVTELLLDGQQRLTSLWKAFNGTASVGYYVRVEDISQRPLIVSRIESASRTSPLGRALLDASYAYAENLIPLEILRDLPSEDPDVGQIWTWSSHALGGGNESRSLERRIGKLREQLLFDRYLHYCVLGTDTTDEKAIEIFVESNQSPVKVNEFDIAVALAFAGGAEELRDRISHFNEHSGITPHYFKNSDDDEDIIPRLGEWLLFAVCLHRGVAPKKQNFERIIKRLFKEQGAGAQDTLQQLLENIEFALNKLSEHGAPTRDTLPALPPMHVLAALRNDLDNVGTALRRSIVNRLLSSYIWRSFLTDRYERQANDRLYEDFSGLRSCIREITAEGFFRRGTLPPIFNVEVHPLPDADDLGNLDRPVPWIKRASRLGRAIASITLSQLPHDWVTGDRLDTTRIRRLEQQGELDRHHIFPRTVLRNQLPGEPKDQRQKIYHGLNGVVLDGSTNNSIPNRPPSDYLEWIVQQRGGPAHEDQLRSYVEGHLVPYHALTITGGTLHDRYENFIRERARVIAAKVLELTALPEAE